MIREGKGARRYNTLVTLTYSDKVVDDFGHVSYVDAVQIAGVYADVRKMSATKTMMTFQQADVVGLEIEMREPGVVFNGMLWEGHDVHFSEPEELERGRILKIMGWYQADR